MQTLAAIASDTDVTVTEDIIDKLIHRGLLEFTVCARLAAERSRTLDFLR